MDMSPTMSEPYRPTRLFTVATANEMLPVVAPILERMQRDQQSLDDTGNRLDAISEAMRSNGHALEAFRLEQEALRLRKRITEDVLHLAHLGVEVKNIATGLIDFPAIREGEIVLLCWMLGEQEIAFWHSLQAGFAGRRPIDFTGETGAPD